MKSSKTLVGSALTALLTLAWFAPATASPDLYVAGLPAENPKTLNNMLTKSLDTDLNDLNLSIGTLAATEAVQAIGTDAIMYAFTDNATATTFALNDQDDQTLTALITVPAADAEIFLLTKSTDNVLFSGAALAPVTGTNLADMMRLGLASNSMFSGGADAFLATVTFGAAPSTGLARM